MAAGPGRIGLGLRFIRIVQRLRVDRVAEGADREPQQIRRAAPAEDLQRDGAFSTRTPTPAVPAATRTMAERAQTKMTAVMP
ncbi:hypothetical protein WU86_06530 [Corynebacterium xerosis]|nr:hypothetical protein WU86_06530 [Corynebacterium xerosis]